MKEPVCIIDKWTWKDVLEGGRTAEAAVVVGGSKAGAIAHTRMQTSYDITRTRPRGKRHRTGCVREAGCLSMADPVQ